MFVRATITLGIGPHSSLLYVFVVVSSGCWLLFSQYCAKRLAEKNVSEMT